MNFNFLLIETDYLTHSFSAGFLRFLSKIIVENFKYFHAILVAKKLKTTCGIFYF
jgi:hypothetical protein